MTSHSLRVLFLNALRGYTCSTFVDITCEEMGQWVMNRGVALQKLQVGYMSSDKLDLYAPHFPTATHLNLSSFCYISSEDFSTLAETCRFLTHINLADCDLTCETLEQLLVRNPSLMSINLSDCSRVTDSSMTLLGQLAPSLQILDMSYCTDITDDGLSAFSSGSGNTGIITPEGAMCQQPLGEANPTLPPLVELSFTQCHRITDRGLACLLLRPRCLHLRRLDLGHCVGVSGDAMCDVARHCRQLQYLLLTNCHELPESCLFAIATHCSELVHLDVFNCSDMVTDSGTQALAAGCSRLHTLNMYNCKNLSDAALRTLAQSCKGLRELIISSCVLVSDSGLYALADHCRELQLLDLSYCTKITNRGVDALRRECLQLTSLNVFKCTSVRNLDLMALYTN